MQTITLKSRDFEWVLPENDVLTKPFIGEKDHEPHLTKFIDEFVEEGDVVMDIGACFGFHTLHLARKVGKSGKVYAFEPQKDMYSLLNQNLFNNELFNTTVFNHAVGDVNQEVCMYNAYEDETNYGDSFISWKYREEDATSDLLEHSMIGKGGKTLDLNKQVSYCKTLDSMNFEFPVKFIKIDVQGFERMVLEGGEEFLKKHRPVMVIEFEDTCMQFHGYGTKELMEYLRERSYNVIFLDHHYPCDHICVPQEKMYDFYTKFKGRIHPHTQDNPINHNLTNGVTHKLTL